MIKTKLCWYTLEERYPEGGIMVLAKIRGATVEKIFTPANPGGGWSILGDDSDWWDTDISCWAYLPQIKDPQ